MSHPLGIVLGSGLGRLAERIVVEEEIGFAEAGLPRSSVEGHDGRFVAGRLGGREVIAMRGRIHLYEGHDARAVTAGLRWLHERGVRELVLTNAAGTLNEAHPPGGWMMLADHLNLTGTSPLEGGPNFIDLSEVYDHGLRRGFRALAVERDMVLHEGVYAGLRGPQYETPAEIRMLRTMGADAVGMSTVLEAIQARALGMRVAGGGILLPDQLGGRNVAGQAGPLRGDRHRRRRGGRDARFVRGVVPSVGIPGFSAGRASRRPRRSRRHRRSPPWCRCPACRTSARR